MDKEEVIYSIKRKEVVHMLGHLKELNLTICNNMDDGPRRYYAK